MSSEAARKAYPLGGDPWNNMVHFLNQEAFDRGAVEALRRAASQYSMYGDGEIERDLNRMADGWERGSA